MTAKQVLFHAAARDKVRRGAARRCHPGNPWASLESGADSEEMGRAMVCNDGVTIAKEFELKDPEENLATAS